MKTTELLTFNRPARIESDVVALDAEYRAANWVHHRLLDFEDRHQKVLNEAAEKACPGISKIERIVVRLTRRAKRAERSLAGTWCPNPRHELCTALKARLAELREVRNADPGWREALKWDKEQVGPAKKTRRRKAKPPEKVKRRKYESDEAFNKRFNQLTTDESDEHYALKLENPKRDTRRDVYRKELYKEIRCYWGTWNGLLKSVDQARETVLKLRKQGRPAEWRRPRREDSRTLCADRNGFRIIDKGPLWWTIEMRLGTKKNKAWARFRTKVGNWHEVPDDAKITTAKLTRRADGMCYRYSVSLTIEGIEKKAVAFAKVGRVAFDWGHREHGHPEAHKGIRAFVWLGADGRKGEVLIPAKCRKLLDEIDKLKSRADSTFATRKVALKLPEKSRYSYRRRLMRQGVRTEEEAMWLRWEMRYERRIMRRRRQVLDLRGETYVMAVRELRRRYKEFVFEGESVSQLKEVQKDEQMPRRKRANRDLAVRHEFVSLCERFGAKSIPVSARNTTRECPEAGCDGLLPENGPELIVACPKCGKVRDKDYGAARVILARSYGPLASPDAAA